MEPCNLQLISTARCTTLNIPGQFEPIEKRFRFLGEEKKRFVLSGGEMVSKNLECQNTQDTLQLPISGEILTYQLAL
jgi:hypothetical protein